MSSATPSSFKILSLGVLDQILVRTYVQFIYVFSLPDATKIPEAIKSLERGVSAIKNRWPFLNGHLHQVGSNVKSNLLEVRYSDASSQLRDTLILRTRDISMSHDFGFSYDELKALGFPSSKLARQLLCALGPSDRLDGAYPVMGVQANFIEDGLLLSFSFDHSVMDGVSIGFIIDYFGKATSFDFEPVQEGWRSFHLWNDPWSVSNGLVDFVYSNRCSFSTLWYTIGFVTRQHAHELDSSRSCNANRHLQFT
jgi:hypothetical protein